VGLGEGCGTAMLPWLKQMVIQVTTRSMAMSSARCLWRYATDGYQATRLGE
jgi:hypothetical protein